MSSGVIYGGPERSNVLQLKIVKQKRAAKAHKTQNNKTTV